MKKIHLYKTIIIGLAFFLFGSLLPMPEAESATMQDYCIVPPFVTQSVPPLVMLAMGRDHKIYYEAYNDAYDLDEDKRLDTGYKHSIYYYGYFDPNRCYTYDSSGTARFVPVAGMTADKFCSSGQWSGNVLNYLTMSKMDVVRKAFYGGHRVSASSNVLERTYIPQDAHSWGKEFTGRLCNSGATYTNQCSTTVDCESGYTCVDKSANLIGIAAATAPVTCTPNPVPKVCSVSTSTSCGGDADCPGGEKCVFTRTAQILLAKYNHASSKTAAANANNHANLVASYEPDNFVSLSYIADFNDAALRTNSNHGDHFNYFLMTEFQVTAANTGNWNFALDSDAAAEIEIDGAVVLGRFGAQTRCNPATSCPQSGLINLAVGWHRVIVRHFEQTGNDGVRLWYDPPGATSWTYFGNTLTLRSPDIDPGGTGNMCSIKTADFISTGTPSTDPFISGTAKHHLFCNTSLGDGPSFPPLLRLVTDRSERIWQWASKERPVCNSPGTSGYPFGATTPTDYAVRVEVCTSAEAGSPTTYFNNYCRYYPGGGGGYMPSGLIQKFGEGDGTKICSKQFTKPCNTDSDCSSGEGICVDRTKMLFGLISGSNTKNLSGGVLRKNVGSILDEVVSTSGAFQTSENVAGNLINTMELMKTVGFRYSDWSYQDASGGNCGWITGRAITEGECRMWGNPIAEILYETTRYFTDKGTPTSDFMYSTNDDSGLNLSKLGTGPKPWIAPYSRYPNCARPFVLTFSDISPSYDSDKVPGSSFGGIAGDLPGLNVSTLVNTIGTTEGIAGTNRFIGESGGTDTLCTSKSVANLSSIRGICPEEPTKQGSFYSSAVSYYGKEKLRVCSNNAATICTADSDCTGGKCIKRNLTTYSVAMSSPVPDINLKIGGKNLRFVPTGKSVNGCLGVDTACSNRCSFSYDANGIHITSCPSNGYCPTNQIVDFYVDTITYDASNNLQYAKFRINFEDVEQGADHDMDAIVTYEIEPDPADPDDRIIVSLSSDYAAGCIAQALGFVITGTSEDGVYLPVRDADTATSDARIGSLPLNWQKTFTVTGGATEVLKDPLWYTAKWGGFDDSDGDGIPYTNATCGTASPDAKCSEWDNDKDGIPDTYFLVVNPLKMEQQIEKALLSILAKASSGTAASVLASGDSTGANLAQAVFYPKSPRPRFSTDIDWIGTLQTFWYYIDPYFSNSSIREDTDSNRELNVINDYIAQFYFDTADSKTKAKLWQDTDGDGDADTAMPTVEFEKVMSLWEAGRILWNTATADRTIYTPDPADSSPPISLLSFDAGNRITLRDYLQAGSNNESEAIIRYMRGEDNPVVSGTTYTYRPRTVAIDLNSDGDTTDTVTINGVAVSESAKVWKLGDVVNSTPKIMSWTYLNTYDQTYGDTTYKAFLDTAGYKDRGMVFVGANDGMLHAFKLGKLEILCRNCTTPARLTDADLTTLGKEMWAFIPKNVLPYLKYNADPTYCHVFNVDLSPYIFDASINGLPNDAKDVNSWRTIVIGGMRLGGACKDAASPNGVTVPAAGKGYSSYFAIDVTDQNNPTLLWEFSDPTLGFATTGPAIVRIGDNDKTKNGRWFVVLGSGPTGPIDTTTHQFKGYSDQNLKLFIVDLKNGPTAGNFWTLDTGITNAFAGSMINTTNDPDLDYNDDAVYVPFIKRKGAGTAGDPYVWEDGGVGRLFTKENQDPAQWVWNKVIDGAGPVTSSVQRLQHKNKGQLWLYFGAGRYYSTQDTGSGDLTKRWKLFGFKDPCFSYSGYDTACVTQLTTGDLDDVTNIADVKANPDDVVNGWYINLDTAGTGYGAERVITDPLATTLGVVFYTTYKPYDDICQYGGKTVLWAVKYATGGSPSALEGVALIQVSTGAIEQVNLASALTEHGGRSTTAMEGVPPTAQGLSIITSPPPVKRTIHIRER